MKAQIPSLELEETSKLMGKRKSQDTPQIYVHHRLPHAAVAQTLAAAYCKKETCFVRTH
jgi:hypothetical protein